MVDLKVTIILTGSTARSLHGLAPGTDESLELLQTAEMLGATLEPLHPGVDDPTLSAYFTANVPDREAAERLITKLQQLPSVEGAYTKPPDEPP